LELQKIHEEQPTKQWKTGAFRGQVTFKEDPVLIYNFAEDEV
jgi:hypothetical protein